MSEPLGSNLGFNRGVLKDATQCACGKILLVGYEAYVNGTSVRCPTCQLKARVGTMNSEEAEEFLRRIYSVTQGEET